MQSNYFVSDIQSMINSSHMAAVQNINGPHQLISSQAQNGNVVNAMHSNGQSMLSISTAPAIAQSHGSHATESHRCTVCGETFRKMANLKRHMKTHALHQPKVGVSVVAIGTVSNAESDSPYKCNACKIEYPNAAIFEHHIRTEHGQAQALKCTECGCFRPILLSSVTPFRCESCTERRGHGFDETGLLHYRVTSTASATTAIQPLFVSPSKVTKMDVSAMITTPRMTEAIGRRPRKLHQCMECGKTYKHQSTLAMHKKIHTGEYKYKCEYCFKEFYLSEYYSRHLRVHTKEKPYQCDVCLKSFSQSNTLTQHKRIHTGEKPYECNICSKSFTVKDYLMKHIRVHTGEKPFECDICCKKYTQRSGLRTHQKTHFQHQNQTEATQSMPAVVVVAQPRPIDSSVRLM